MPKAELKVSQIRNQKSEIRNAIMSVSIDTILGQVKEYIGEADITPIREAYEFAARIHNGQRHQTSGEPYVNHVLAVGLILAGMRLDMQTIMAGLLHGVLKADPSLSIKQVEELFGRDVANIVKGATRITSVQFNSQLTYQAENIRKLLLAMASDLRVLLVKLADRLHDLRSFSGGESEICRELAQETMELYAPLSSRLGIDWMKRELEDLSFKYMHPDEFAELDRKIVRSTSDRQAYVEEVIGILREKLAENNLTVCTVTGRPKHLYSIYKKIIAQKIPVEKVYDKVAFRIIVNTIKECYEALGTVHANWSPVPGRIKDFISTPKTNNYRSMHTTVVGPHGEFMEVQIRTHEMDKVAQEGVAAHWAYKEGQAISQEDARVFKGLKQLVQWLQELKDPKEFLDSVRGELFESDVYALTPNGDVKELPFGSTPIDFAYVIHTEVGHHCTGAKVNGRIVPLKYQIQNGDLVEIITSPKQKPTRGWLALVKTSRAKSRIRQWLRRQEHEKAVNVGRELCERELRKHDITLKKLIKTGHIKKLLKDLRCNSLDDLLGKIGSGGITMHNAMKVFLPEEMKTAAREGEIQTAADLKDRRADKTSSPDAITIQGVDDMLVKISQCCLPVPGDAIMGFITTGRGISIHRADCPNLHATDPQRRIEVNWTARAKAVHKAHIMVVTQNRKGMLADISTVISKLDADILALDARTTPDNLATNSITVEVENISHLRSILQHLRRVDGVIEARRV